MDDFRPFLGNLKPGQRFFRVTDDTAFRSCEMLGVINGRRYYIGQDGQAHIVDKLENQCQVTLA